MSLKLFLVMLVLLGVMGYVVFSEHPVSMGFWFVLLSGVASMSVGVELTSFMGYLMFFVYVGALLVMFCMVTSLAPNPVFRVVPMMGMLPFLGLKVYFSFMDFTSKGELSYSNSYGDVFFGLGLYDGLGWGMVLVWLGLILLLAMISVVSMSKWSVGPLVRFSWK